MTSVAGLHSNYSKLTQHCKLRAYRKVSSDCVNKNNNTATGFCQMEYLQIPHLLFHPNIQISKTKLDTHVFIKVKLFQYYDINLQQVSALQTVKA